MEHTWGATAGSPPCAFISYPKEGEVEGCTGCRQPCTAYCSTSPHPPVWMAEKVFCVHPQRCAVDQSAVYRAMTGQRKVAQCVAAATYEHPPPPNAATMYTHRWQAYVRPRETGYSELYAMIVKMVYKIFSVVGKGNLYHESCLNGKSQKSLRTIWEENSYFTDSASRVTWHYISYSYKSWSVYSATLTQDCICCHILLSETANHWCARHHQILSQYLIME